MRSFIKNTCVMTAIVSSICMHSINCYASDAKKEDSSKKIDLIIANQEKILAELEDIKERLRILKVRVSSR